MQQPVFKDFIQDLEPVTVLSFVLIPFIIGQSILDGNAVAALGWLCALVNLMAYKIAKYTLKVNNLN